MGMIQPGRDGKVRVFVDEKQHVQMPGGGHIIFMENTERSDQAENSTGCWGEWEGRVIGCISCCCVLLRDTEVGNPGSAPKELTDGLGRQDRAREVRTRPVARWVVGTIGAARVLRRHAFGQGWPGFRLRWIRLD